MKMASDSNKATHYQQDDDVSDDIQKSAQTPYLHQTNDGYDQNFFQGFEGLSEEEMNVLLHGTASVDEDVVTGATVPQPLMQTFEHLPETFNEQNINIEDDTEESLEEFFDKIFASNPEGYGFPVETTINAIDQAAGTKEDVSPAQVRPLDHGAPPRPNALMQGPMTSPVVSGNASDLESPSFLTTSTSLYPRPQAPAKMPTTTVNHAAPQPGAAPPQFWNHNNTFQHPEFGINSIGTYGALHQQYQAQGQHPNQTQKYAGMPQSQYNSSSYGTGSLMFEQGRGRQHEVTAPPYRIAPTPTASAPSSFNRIRILPDQPLAAPPYQMAPTPIAPAPSSFNRIRILSDQPLVASTSNQAPVAAIPRSTNKRFKCVQCRRDAPVNGKNDGKHCTKCFNNLNAKMITKAGKPKRKTAAPTSVTHDEMLSNAYTGDSSSGGTSFANPQQGVGNGSGAPFAAAGGIEFDPGFDLEHQSVEAALEYIERTPENDCYKLQIQGDDWETLSDFNGEFKSLCQQLFDALRHPGGVAPVHFNQEQSDTYDERSSKAYASVLENMQTPEQIREVKARVIKAMNEVIRVHQVGVPKTVLQQTKNRGYEVDTESKCSVRAQKVISYTQTSKFIALDILRSKNLAQLARSPDGYLLKKYGDKGTAAVRGADLRDLGALKNRDKKTAEVLSGNLNSIQPANGQSMSVAPSSATNATPQRFLVQPSPFSTISTSPGALNFQGHQLYSAQPPTIEGISTSGRTASQGGVNGGVKRARSNEEEDSGENGRYVKRVRDDTEDVADEDGRQGKRPRDDAEEDSGEGGRYGKRSTGGSEEDTNNVGRYGKRSRSDAEEDADEEDRYEKRARVDRNGFLD